jgi:hypothetical protein
MEQIRANMTQVRPHMPHVKADMTQVRLDMEQIRPAAILFPANRLCKRSNVILLRRHEAGSDNGTVRRRMDNNSIDADAEPI